MILSSDGGQNVTFPNDVTEITIVDIDSESHYTVNNGSLL